MQSIQGALPHRQEPAPTGYTRVSNLIRTLGLSPREEQLVTRLLECWRPGQMPWPSVKTLALRMDCSVRTVQRAINGMEARNLLVVEYRYRADGSQQSSVYHLADVLTPQHDQDGAISSPTRHQGVTRMAAKEQHPGKNTKRSSATGAGYDVAAYLAREAASYQEAGAKYGRYRGR